MDLIHTLFGSLPRQGAGSDADTLRALAATDLVERRRPRIADLGCGTGTPTLALARAAPFEILAVDLDPLWLDRLRERARAERLVGSIETRLGSIDALDLAPASLDAVWSEGAIYNLGFANGLASWRKLVMPGGWLVVSELSWIAGVAPEQARIYWSRNYAAMSSVEVNLDIIGTLGLELVEHFALGRNAFWQEYYQPMEQRIAELRAGSDTDESLFRALEREIEVYRRWGDSYGYVFYVIRVPR